jgi:hypothetical protein
MVTQSDDCVARTLDGRYTWELQTMPYCSGAYDVWFSDENNGWAVGTNGIILHTDNGGTVGIDEFKVQSAKFKVECFPNPLRSVTMIEYELTQTAFFTLEIFNFTGQLVDILANERQSSGLKRVTWNAEKLSAGIFFTG